MKNPKTNLPQGLIRAISEDGIQIVEGSLTFNGQVTQQWIGMRRNITFKADSQTPETRIIVQYQDDAM